MAGEYELEDVEGVGPATARKLREAGYSTVESLAVATAFELSEAAGIGYDVALKISQRARELVRISLVTADEVYKRRQLAQKITTGSKALDALLGGGVETQALTELVGEFGTGKTQLCHSLSVTVQLPKDKGGLQASALYIDTEGTFRPERIVQIAKRHGLDAEKALKNIVYARVYNSDHQVLLVDKAWEVCGEKDIRLIVVDSLTSLFRGEYLGREALALRQQRLNSHVHKLLKLAEALNLAVVVTNQVVANPGQFFGDPNKPAGGNVVAHACTYRVYLRRGKEKTRVATMIDAPHLPYGEASFLIGEGGVYDAPGAG
ncbi:MAG: DNA repair and recombination protein RadA [Thermoproteota archaeon]